MVKIGQICQTLNVQFISNNVKVGMGHLCWLREGIKLLWWTRNVIYLIHKYHMITRGTEMRVFGIPLHNDMSILDMGIQREIF